MKMSDKPSRIQKSYSELIKAINEMAKEAGGLRVSDIAAIRSTTDSIRELRQENIKLVEALQAAMNYINECPCDPDIYPEQLEAWNKLKSLNVKDLIND